MHLPILTPTLIDQLERSEVAYMIDRMNAIRERPGNPMGIEMAAFGTATAFYSEAMPWPQFNAVKGIGAGEIELLDDMLAFYRERERKPQFEVVPGRDNPALMQALTARGFYFKGYHATLYGELDAASAEAVQATEGAGLCVHELEEAEFDRYAEIHCRGTGLPLSGVGPVADNNKVLYNRPGWQFFIAELDGIPAGAGVMYAEGEVASLTFAATLPEFRNRGVQRALLAKRITKAYQNGQRLIVGQAAYASASFRNMQRTGLALGYTRGAWVTE